MRAAFARMCPLLLLTACSGTTPQGNRAEDARVYAEVAAQPSEDPTRDLQRCEAIVDDDTRGDCELMVVQRIAERADSAPEEGCAKISHDTWRHECFFQAAEHWVKHDEPGRAVALCAEAGPFKEDCGQHLWQDEMGAIIGRKGAKRLAHGLPRAQRLYDTWQPHLDGEGDFPWRFWRRYYEMGFEPERLIDLADCDALPGHHAELCRIAAARVYMRRMSDRIMSPQGRQSLCGLEEPVSTDALARSMPGMDVRPHELLDRVLAEQHARICKGGDPETDGPSEVVGPEVFMAVIREAEATP